MVRTLDLRKKNSLQEAYLSVREEKYEVSALQEKPKRRAGTD